MHGSEESIMETIKIVRIKDNSFDIIVNNLRKGKSLTRELAIIWLTERGIANNIASSKVDYAGEVGQETFESDLGPVEPMQF